MRSLPKPPTTVLLPPPEKSVSFPPLPKTRSAPVPPSMLSAPSLESLPPMIVWADDPPVEIVSAPSAPAGHRPGQTNPAAPLYVER
jgi:hypothetical protein